MKLKRVDGLFTFRDGVMPMTINLRLSVGPTHSTISLSDDNETVMYTVSFDEVMQLYETMQEKN